MTRLIICDLPETPLVWYDKTIPKMWEHIRHMENERGCVWDQAVTQKNCFGPHDNWYNKWDSQDECARSPKWKITRSWEIMSLNL